MRNTGANHVPQERKGLASIITAPALMRWLRFKMESGVPQQMVAAEMFSTCTDDLKQLALAFTRMGWNYSSTITLLQFLDEAIKHGQD